MLACRLEEVDIGYDTILRPTFVNKNLKTDCKAKLTELMKGYVTPLYSVILKCHV